MTVVIEKLALNPVEFVPERPEVDLHSLGLEIAKEPGPDYGESSVTVERVRQAIGEGVVDRRWPSVECTIPLIARGTEDRPIADPLHRVEATVADIARRGGGWIRRDFSEAGGFAGSVCCPVDAAGLAGVQGWSLAHRQFAPNLVLKLSRSPIWYATVKQEGVEVSATGVRDLKWEIAEMLGTAPGLISVRVTNEGEADLRGLMACIESDYYSSASTADLVYECEDLTLGRGAEVKTRTGASGGEVVRVPLTAGWIQGLSSEIAGVGHMTHTGVRRMKMRVFDPSPSVGAVQFQLEYRALGASTWSPNRIMEAPLVGDFSIIDLGECRPEIATLGEQRWEWRLMLRAPAGEGTVDLDLVWPLAVEQMLVITTPEVAQAADLQSPSKAPGTVENKEGVGTVAWEAAAEAKVSDDKRAAVTLKKEEVSQWLVARNFGHALPEDATVLGRIFTVERSIGGAGHHIRDYAVRAVKGGVIGEADRARVDYWSNDDAAVSYGGSSDLIGFSWTASDVNASTSGVAIAVVAISADAARVDAVTSTVYYTEAADENKVCFASRSIDLRTQGVHRQHPTDDIWGRLLPEAGSIFQAPAGGLEKRAARGIVVPSQGDFGVLADAGAHDLAIEVDYNPGYLFAREAAA